MSYFSNQTLEDIPEYIINETIDSSMNISKSTSTLCNEDVMDEDLLNDYWNIDDFLVALPQTIEYGIDNIIYSLQFIYNDITSSWNIYYYNKKLNKSIYTISNIDPYECFKQMYYKLKITDKLF